MNYLSVASGIESATVAWHSIGWEAAAYSEIEPFPCAVLSERWPATPNLGDMTKYREWKIDGSIDILVGGTPCQSFSVAGLRRGLDDPRGNLMLVYLAIARHFRPAWIVWENVPGVLSSNGGRDFGSFLAGLAELGYGFAYRVLDAQFFGVPQRRRREFVVGYLGDWRPAAAVLFERESVQGAYPPARATPVSVCLTARGAGSLDDRETYIIDVDGRIRHMTPVEWERLLGFPDNYTAITYRGKPASDGPRYKSIGNSMAVPVMRWIGERIEKVTRILIQESK